MRALQQFLRDVFAGMREEAVPRIAPLNAKDSVYVTLASQPDHIMVAQRHQKHGWSLHFYQIIPDGVGYNALSDKKQDDIWQKVGFSGCARHAVSTDFLMQFCQQQLNQYPDQPRKSIGAWKHFSGVQVALQRREEMILGGLHL